MLRKTLAITVALGLTLAATLGHADTPAMKAVSANGGDAIALLAKSIQEKFPHQPAPKSIATTPIPGVYELLLDDQIAYVDANATYFFFNAAMVDLKKQINITQARRGELLKIDISQLDIKDAIVQVKGDGKQRLYVFSDPYCPYCQKLEDELETMSNVTIITFMIPRPAAKIEAESIWCSDKPQDAWLTHMKTKAATAVKSCDNPVERNLALAQKLNINGTPTLFSEDGRRNSGYMPLEQIQDFLKQSNPRTVATAK